MAKIQARNVDDALFARIEQSAMKNERSLEGEIRLALARQYPAGTTSLNRVAICLLIICLKMMTAGKNHPGDRCRVVHSCLCCAS